MSLFVLREGYRVVTTPSGARVVNVRTGESVDLSPEDVLLLARATAGGVDAKDPQLRNVIRKFVVMGVLRSASEPAKGDKPSAESGGSAAAVGPDVPPTRPTSADSPPSAGAPSAPRPPSIAPPSAPAPIASPSAVLRPPSVPPAPPAAASSIASALSIAAGSPPKQAISSTGLAPPAPASTANEPLMDEWAIEDERPLVATRSKAEEVVRLFRADLKINRRASSNLLDVTDPQTGKSFPLYDFEISLARMLDGRRAYSDVVDSGQRLGIPVNRESLLQFIRQLDRYGFLAPAETQSKERGEGDMWAPRQKWDEGLRALFQSGLRMHRQGRYAEAGNYFEAMLQQDPQNPEATEMLDQARQRLTGAPGAMNEAILAPADSRQVSLDDLLIEEDEPRHTLAATTQPQIADFPALDAPRADELSADAPTTDAQTSDTQSTELPGTDQLDPGAMTSAPPVPSPLRSKTAVWSAERTRPAPRRKIAWLPIGVALGVLATVLVAGWYVYSLEFETSAAAAKLAFKKRLKNGPPKLAASGADGGQTQAAVVVLDAGAVGPTTMLPRKDAPPAMATSSSQADAGSPHATPKPELAAKADVDAGPVPKGSVDAALALKAALDAGLANKGHIDAGLANKETIDAGALVLPREATANVHREPVAAQEAARPVASISIPDAGLPTPIARAALERPALPDAGARADEAPGVWIAAKIENRGRVTMGELIAPADGIVSWKASANQRVRRGESIGKLQEKDGSGERSLVAPKDGLFIPKVGNRSAVTESEKLAAIVYHEAYLQALVADAQPEPTWSCEIYHASSSGKASCKIVEVVKRGSKSFVTATTEPIWFDTADDARVRLSPPR